jgi:F-type H+-transporting ATPase subunit a
VPKRGCLGCSFPMLIGIMVVTLIILAIGFAAGPIGRSMFGDIEWLNWLQTSRPELHLPAEEVFTLFGFPITNTVVTAWITIIFLVVFSYVATRRMKLIPGRLQAAFEALLGWIYNLCCDVAGEKNGRRFFPVVVTIFLFVGFNAWLALLPGYGSIIIHTAEGEVPLIRPANTDINMPLAIAVISVLSVQFFGLRTLGMPYVGKFINIGGFVRSSGKILRGKVREGFSGLITGIIEIGIGFLEFFSEISRILSFTFRLFGNMTAGELLILVALFLVPTLFVLPFYGLELLIGFIQAMIFAGLTLIFLTVAVYQHEEAG